MVRLILAAFLALLLTGCATFGNTGPIEITCKSAEGAEFQFKLPMGSGREYPDGILTTADHACGELQIPAIRQGEDRSPGLLGVLLQFIGL